jgi:hypothetical protein
MSSWSIGIACASEMGSPWAIFFFIVRLLASYGMPFPIALGCPELCLVKWLICLLSSGLVVELRTLLCGR